MLALNTPIGEKTAAYRWNFQSPMHTFIIADPDPYDI